MTQILVTLNDGAATQTVRRAIGLLRGVASTTVMKTKSEESSKTLGQQKFVKDSLTRALNEVKEAKNAGRKLQSLDDFLEEQRKEAAL